MKARLLGAVCAVLFTFTTLLANAALVDNGGGLIYDTVLDITWAQPSARRDWDEINAWVSGLTLGGVSDWRLPYISVQAGAGPLSGIPGPVDCNTATELSCRDNELGYMFYHNLSGTYFNSVLTSGDPDLALFPSLVARPYWSGTRAAGGGAWYFFFDGGFQTAGFLDDSRFSWAVHSGNISPVPVPAAVWLFSFGLLGMIGIARRKKAA